MFVRLIDGPEPFDVNPDNVCAFEGTSGGRDTMVILVNGGSKLCKGLTVDAIRQRIAEARQPDWLQDEPKKGTKR